MLTELSIRNDLGDSLSLPIPFGRDGYQVTEIEGLDPVPVSLASSEYSNLDGDRYHSERREKRNIVIKISMPVLYLESSVDARRKRLYSLFVSGGNIRLVFSTPEYGSVYIEGRVESIESPSWTEKPIFVVSVVCFYPHFRSFEPVTIEGTYPASVPVEYKGTIPSGFEWYTWHAQKTANYGSLEATVITPGLRSEFFLWTGSMDNQHVLVIDSQPGSRRVTAEQRQAFPPMSSVVVKRYSLLAGVDRVSTWPKLYPGENTLSLEADRPSGELNFRVVYHELFGGI